jgi:hypothetical protein
MTPAEAIPKTIKVFQKTRYQKLRTETEAQIRASFSHSIYRDNTPRVGAHLSVHRMLWVTVGALVASAPGVQAEEGQQRYTSRTTPHVTCVTRHAQNVTCRG